MAQLITKTKDTMVRTESNAGHQVSIEAQMKETWQAGLGARQTAGSSGSSQARSGLFGRSGSRASTLLWPLYV